MAGLRVLMSKNKTGLVLDIPTKDRGRLQYFTSASGVIKLIEGKIPFVYFNPRSDFDDGRTNPTG